MFDEEYDLSLKQRELALEYLENGFNQTKAYQEVYQCDIKAAQTNAYRMFKNPEIKRFISDVLQEKLNVHLLNSDIVISQIMNIAFNPDEKTSDRLKALEMLGKNLQLFSEKIDISSSGLSINIIDDIS